MRARLHRLVIAMLASSALLNAQSFEVATVKPTPAGQQGIEQPSIVQFLPDGFRRTNSTLRTLVRTAYDVQEYQVVGGPAWADRTRFDIEARHVGTVSRSDVLRMLQHLLEERFALRVNRATPTRAPPRVGTRSSGYDHNRERQPSRSKLSANPPTYRAACGASVWRMT